MKNEKHIDTGGLTKDEFLGKIEHLLNNRPSWQVESEKWFEGLEPERKAYLRNMRAQEIIIDAARQFHAEGKKPRYIHDLQEFLNYLWEPNK